MSWRGPPVLFSAGPIDWGERTYAMPVEENPATAQSLQMHVSAVIERVELYQIEGGALAKAPNAPSANPKERAKISCTVCVCQCLVEARLELRGDSGAFLFVRSLARFTAELMVKVPSANQPKRAGAIVASRFHERHHRFRPL